MSSYAAVRLAIDKYKEEADEATLYQEWMKEQQEYRAKRSLWSNIGKGIGLLVSMLSPGLGTAAGFAIGAGIGQAGGRIHEGTGKEALEFGGKFDTQGEREAEMAMEGAEYHWSDELTTAMETAVQYYQLGGRFGKQPPPSGGGITEPTTTSTTTSPSNLWETFQDPQNWVPEATAAFLVSQHGGFGGGSSESEEETTQQTSTSPGGGGYEDDTDQGYGGTSADEEYQQWLASMGIQSPIYNNNGLV